MDPIGHVFKIVDPNGHEENSPTTPAIWARHALWSRPARYENTVQDLNGYKIVDPKGHEENSSHIGGTRNDLFYRRDVCHLTLRWKKYPAERDKKIIFNESFGLWINGGPQ